jgi:hypothetical protein
MPSMICEGCGDLEQIRFPLGHALIQAEIDFDAGVRDLQRGGTLWCFNEK